MAWKMESRGKESRTLTFVSVAYWMVTFKYVVGGVAYAGHGLTVNIPHMSANEYSLAIGAILLIWLGREWTEKVSAPKAPAPVATP